MKKLAVCFGINDYPGESNDLNFCVNDAIDWTNFFAGIGYEVKTFLNEECTMQRFVQEVTNVILQAEAGDHIAITYSGHGTQVYDRSGDEPDGYDEAICLYDGNFIDDKVADLIRFIKDDVNAFFNFDACFSGTATRNRMGVNIKFRKTDEIPMNKRNKRRKRFGRSIVVSGMKEVFMSGCSDKEYSYDAFDLNNGAQTYYALDTFVRGMAFKEWHTAVRKKLPSSKYPQSPQLEGTNEKINKVAFGLDDYDYVKPSGCRFWRFIKSIFA